MNQMSLNRHRHAKRMMLIESIGCIGFVECVEFVEFIGYVGL